MTLALSHDAFRLMSPLTKFSLVDLAERLGAFIERSGKTQRKIAEEAGIPNPSYLSHMKNGRINWVESEYFRPLSRVLDLSIDEIQELNPDLVIQPSPLTLAAPTARADLAPQVPSASELPDYILVPIYALASAGLSATEAQPLHDYAPIAFPREAWHPALRLFLAVGESMDSGREDGIRHGDILQVDMREVDPRPGRVCVVQAAGDGIFVKRVRQFGAALWLMSDNPDQERYAPFQVDEARVLGSVFNVTRSVPVHRH
jgi:SOS-response transcriptional repressor LexA